MLSESEMKKQLVDYLVEKENLNMLQRKKNIKKKHVLK